MTKVEIEQKDLDDYSEILNERPMDYKKVNAWWRDKIEKYHLKSYTSCKDWRINFSEKCFYPEVDYLDIG